MWDIEKLQREWGVRLQMFAYSYVRSCEVAEDLVQDVFLKILEQKVDVSTCSNIGPLLYTILRNKCLDYIKHKAVEQKHVKNVEQMHYLLADQDALEDESVKNLTDNEINKILRLAICSLPEQTRKVLILSKFKDKKYQEIAAMCDLTQRQVEYHIAKAMQALKDKMKKY